LKHSLDDEIDNFLFVDILFDVDVDVDFCYCSVVHKTEGEKWEKEVLPTYAFTLQEMGRRQIKMRDWLMKRQLKFQERDKMKKYLAALSKKDPSLTLDEMIRVYYKKKRSQDYTLEELREIYKMKDNKDLSTNDLLKFYRNEVPLLPPGTGYNSTTTTTTQKTQF
jgi:hypothetical protein